MEEAPEGFQPNVTAEQRLSPAPPRDFRFLNSFRDLSKFPGLLFRLDGHEGAVGLSTHLTNLSRLMESSQGRWAPKRE